MATEQASQLAERLCDLEIPADISFSPNGQQIIYTTALDWGHSKGKNPVSTIWIAEAGRPNSARQLTSGQFKDSSPRWNADGESVAFVSDRAKAGEQWAVYILHLKGGEAYPITAVESDKEIAGLEYSPDGQSIAYISADDKTADQKAREDNGEDVQVWGEQWEYGRLRIVNVASKATRCLTVAENKEGERHVIATSWNADGSSIAVASVKNSYCEEPLLTGTTISTVDVNSQKTRDLVTFPSEVHDLTWASDGKIYFWAGTPAGTTEVAKAVYVVDPESASLTYVKRAFGVDSDVTSLSDVTGRGIVACVDKHLSTQISLLDGKVLFSRDHEITAFAAAPGGESEDILLAVAASDLNHPAEVFSFSGGNLIQLSNHGQSFKDRSFGTLKVVNGLSFDQKEELYGLYLTSSEAPHSTGPRPTVVLVHGGPFDRSVNRFNTYYYMWAPALLSLNPSVGILLTNYRGSSGRGERFASYSLGGVGVYDYADVIALTQHAIDAGHIDSKNVMIAGYSQGGFLSYLGAVRNGLPPQRGWKYKAAMPGAGVTDTDAMALESDMGMSAEVELNVGKMPWTMEQYETSNRNASPLWEFGAAVKRAKETGEMTIPPMLIMHGEADLRVPLTQAIGFRRAMRSAGLPLEYVTYPRQDHLFKEQKFWVDMILRLSRFVEEHVGSGGKK